jgi:hypothetical protein
MLDRLVGADRTPELHALLRIAHGKREHALGEPQALRGGIQRPAVAGPRRDHARALPLSDDTGGTGRDLERVQPPTRIDRALRAR